MKNKINKYLIIGIVLFLLFIVFTIIVSTVDVQAIGPRQSRVGLATINEYIFNIFGTNNIWYHITDWIGKIVLLIGLSFAILGTNQALKRRSIFKVDKDVILLGIFYIITIIFYIFFEKYIINYRPILLDGILEASYPSSHTMLVIVIMTTTIIQLRTRIKSKSIRDIIVYISYLVILITIIGRLVSGVHWFSDIIGGILLSSSLCMFYYGLYLKIHRNKYI